MGNSRLPIILEDLSEEYEKPTRRNKLVDDKKYNEIDGAIKNGVKLGSNGVAYVDVNEAPKILQENAGDAQYIIDTFIPDNKKRNVGGKDLVHSASLVGLLDERAQESRSASKQALQQYARDSLINASDSNQAQALRRNLDDFSNKEQKKLRTLRDSTVDEVTGDPLSKGYAFHHKNQKSLHTDPEMSLDPDAGILVNSSTHTKIHQNKLRDERALDEYKKEIGCDSDDT